jgi:hypothetical protein
MVCYKYLFTIVRTLRSSLDVRTTHRGTTSDNETDARHDEQRVDRYLKLTI